jgi:hypothetical protein
MGQTMSEQEVETAVDDTLKTYENMPTTIDMSKHIKKAELEKYVKSDETGVKLAKIVGGKVDDFIWQLRAQNVRESAVFGGNLCFSKDGASICMGPTTDNPDGDKNKRFMIYDKNDKTKNKIYNLHL